MKHTTAFLSALLALTACRGENHFNMGEDEMPTSASVGTGTDGTSDDGWETDPPKYDMPLDGTGDDTGTSVGVGDGDGDGDGDVTTGDGGECDDELLAAMFACVLAGTDELDTPDNTCDQATTPGCVYQQCTGMYYDDYYGALAGVRENCAAIYPVCAEFAQVSYYECLSGCYEVLGNCDDGTDCLSCAGDMGFCIAACDPGPDTWHSEGL